MHKISNQTHPILPFYFGCLKVKQAFLFFQIGHGIDVILYSLMENSFEFLTRFWCNVSYIHPNTNHTKCEEFFTHQIYRKEWKWEDAIFMKEHIRSESARLTIITKAITRRTRIWITRVCKKRFWQNLYKREKKRISEKDEW